MRSLSGGVTLICAVAVGCGGESVATAACLGKYSGEPIDCDSAFAVPAAEYEPPHYADDDSETESGRSGRFDRWGREYQADRRAEREAERGLSPDPGSEIPLVRPSRPRSPRPPHFAAPETDAPSALDEYLEERERQRELEEQLEPSPYEEYLDRRDCLEEAEFFDRPTWRCYSP